jgi:hypothetical protein
VLDGAAVAHRMGMLIRDCTIAALLGALVSLIWMVLLHAAMANVRHPLDPIGIYLAALLIGVPATALVTAWVLRLTGIRPVLIITVCLLATAYCAVTFVHLLQLGGQLGPTWQTTTALAGAYLGAVLIGGTRSWRWIRVTTAVVFAALLASGQPVHHQIVRHDTRNRLAALQVPLLVPRMPGYRISWANAGSGQLYVNLVPVDRQIPLGKEYENTVYVLVRPLPDDFPTTATPTLDQVRLFTKKSFLPSNCTQQTTTVWSCIQDNPLQTMVIAHQGSVLVELTALETAATRAALLDAAQTLYRASPDDLAAVD